MTGTLITAISTIALSTAVFACAPPSIGEYPEYGDKNGGGGADDKAGNDDKNDDDGKTDSKSSQTDPNAPGNAQQFKLTVTLKGTGSITSTPAGVTCTGTTCTGSFAKGTQVTLTPTAGNANFFSTWSGQCTGAANCAPIVNADVAITAEFESFDGKWTGTYTNMRKAFNCNFTNNGNLETTLSTGAASSTANMTGLELRQVPGCGLVKTSTGSAPSASMTLAADKMTGSWTFSVPGASGTVAFPFTATFKGKTMTGTWTCDTCNGGFTLTKQ
jgi:hypothetical protein